jgi:LacI family transcriptional regulator
MSKQRATITDIAKALNVTPSTVSRALKDHPRISEATKQAVLAMAHQLNYQPNHLAAALRNGRSRLLGVVVPTANRDFFSNVIYGIEGVANAAHYSVLICQSHDSQRTEAEIVQVLMQTQVEGIIASLAKETHDFSHYQRVIDKGVPLLLYDRISDDLEVNTVSTDDRLGAYRAVSHLIEQGCRRIAHFTGRQTLNIYRDRLRGYREALDAHELPFDPTLVVENDMKLGGGQASAASLWAMALPPDAIFSASDYAAMGAMQWLKAQGINIPQEVAIVGFSNEPFTELVEPGLSSVDQHSEQMGQVAANIFLDQIKGLNQNLAVRRTVLNPELVIRSSSLRQTSP